MTISISNEQTHSHVKFQMLTQHAKLQATNLILDYCFQTGKIEMLFNNKHFFAFWI